MGYRESDECKIGDFVWGKINGELWWPGQVCDPTEASEELKNLQHLDHHVLVVYYGELTFAWCEPSLLKPFIEEFEQMMEHSSSQSFVTAVKDAMCEMERCLRLDMTCCCVPADHIARCRIDRKNGLGKASIPNYSPGEFLEHLWDVARGVTIANVLEVTMLRSWAASFYLRNGCFVKMIEDLFDEKPYDLNASSGDPVKDKPGLECQTPGGGMIKRRQVFEEQPSRKKRSMVEIIGLPNPKVMQNSVKEGNKGRANDGQIRGSLKPGLYIAQKRKKREKEIEKLLNAGVIKVVSEEENGTPRRERKKSKYLSPPYTSGYTKRSNSSKLVDSEVSENDSETSHHLHHNFPTDFSSQEAFTKKDHQITPSNHNEASSNDLLSNLLLVASNLHVRRNFPSEKLRDFFVRHRSFMYSGISDFESLLECDSDTFVPLRDIVIESNNVASGETSTTLQKNRRILNKEQATEETPMSSSVLNISKGGSKNNSERSTNGDLTASVEELDNMATNCLEESKIEQERSIISCAGNGGKAILSGNEHLNSTFSKSKYNGTNGKYKAELDHMGCTGLVKDVSRSKRTKLVEHDDENSTALLLTFSPSNNLPSKDELLSVFTKYGSLIEHETALFSDTGCARIVFSRGTDAKKALKGIKKINNLSFQVVDCQSFDFPQSTGVPSPTEPSPDTALVYVSQDLQRMIHSLSPKKGSTCHGLRPEVRKDLINDMKGLLNKINKLMTLPNTST